jgi:hypothetical protein
MCLMCEQEALYLAYLRQTADRPEAQASPAKERRSALSADAVEEGVDAAVKPGADKSP